MFGFLDRFLGRGEASRDTAKNRLKLVLLQDRSVIPASVLEQIRVEVMAVLQRYVEIDQRALELNFERSEGSVALLASVPIVRVREDAPQLAARAADAAGDPQEGGAVAEQSAAAPSEEAPGAAVAGEAALT
ncbi:MAG: cell division topological specificity factor MinE [Candidatus Sericytochromatia bacterium]|nr:cell division topological specificity factor MinE [Candidatus Sericytochromatia bacterium]